MRLNILYSTDDNYAQHAGISLISLLDNNKDIELIYIYIIDNNISQENKNRINNIGKDFNRAIIYVPIMEICSGLKKQDDFPLSGYARLFATKIEDVDKVLYLDSDTVINHSLKELWNHNIDEYLVAGVQDNPIKCYSEVIGMEEEDRYLNSGVLLMNLKKWREDNLEEKIYDFIELYNGRVPHHDQGVINGVCRGAILVIHPKYNMMPQFIMHNSQQIKRLYQIKNYYSTDLLDAATNNPIIIHYIGKFYGRPWYNDCMHPYKELYEKYLKMTSWEIKDNNYQYNLGFKTRKWAYNHLPFWMYAGLETVLNIRRKKILKREYAHLSVDIK